MSYIRDLVPISYIGLEGPIRAIGWLEASQPFTRGPVEPEFTRRLMAIVERPILAFVSFGMHYCSLCEAEAKPGPDGRSSQAVLLVPSPDCVYEAPIWIGHYVIKHSYQPPHEFCHAVQTCPEPGSDQFRNALSAHLPFLSKPTEPEGLAFFAQWPERAQQTLQADPEYGSRSRLMEKAFPPATAEQQRQTDSLL